HVPVDDQGVGGGLPERRPLSRACSRYPDQPRHSVDGGADRGGRRNHPRPNAVIPFGELAPDAPAFQPDVLREARGVLPLRVGYGPAQGPLVASGAEALPSSPLGLLSAVKRDGTWKVFACTDDDVLELASDNTWTSIGSEAFACPSGDFWSTLQFGN